MSNLGNRIGYDPRNSSTPYVPPNFLGLACLLFSNLQGAARERVPCGDNFVVASLQCDCMRPEYMVLCLA